METKNLKILSQNLDNFKIQRNKLVEKQESQKNKLFGIEDQLSKLEEQQSNLQIGISQKKNQIQEYDMLIKEANDTYQQLVISSNQLNDILQQETNEIQKLLQENQQSNQFFEIINQQMIYKYKIVIVLIFLQYYICSKSHLLERTQQKTNKKNQLDTGLLSDKDIKEKTQNQDDTQELNKNKSYVTRQDIQNTKKQNSQLEGNTDNKILDKLNQQKSFVKSQSQNNIEDQYNQNQANKNNDIIQQLDKNESFNTNHKNSNIDKTNRQTLSDKNSITTSQKQNQNILNFDEILDLDKTISEEDLVRNNSLNSDQDQKQKQNQEQQSTIIQPEQIIIKPLIKFRKANIQKNFVNDEIYDFAEAVADTESIEDHSDDVENQKNNIQTNLDQSKIVNLHDIFVNRDDSLSKNNNNQNKIYQQKVCNVDVVSIFFNDEQYEKKYRSQIKSLQKPMKLQNILCNYEYSCCKLDQQEELIFLTGVQLKKELKNLQNLIKFFYLINKLGDLQPLITQNLDKLQDCLLDDFNDLQEILKYLQNQNQEIILDYIKYSKKLQLETANLYCYICSMKQRNIIDTFVQDTKLYITIIINKQEEMLNLYKKFSDFYKFEKLIKFTRILQCVYFQQKYPSHNIDIKTFLQIQQQNENDLSKLNESGSFQQLFQEQYLPASSKVFIFEDLLQMFQSTLLENESKYKMNLFPLGNWFPFAYKQNKSSLFIQTQTQLKNNDEGYDSNENFISDNLIDFIEKSYQQLIDHNIKYFQGETKENTEVNKKGIFKSLLVSFKQIFTETFNQFTEN